MGIFKLFHHRPARETFLRNFIFGVEDSLVSTVGLLAGVAAANVSTRTILTTGIVLVVVEGFSMGVGSFLTEETTQEMEGQKPRVLQAFQGACTMLVSYCLAGLLPLSPYIFYSGETAVIISVVVSLLGLLALGYATALYYGRPSPWRRAVKMFFLGGIAVVVGVLIGKVFHL